ncbi:hypothetical protein JKP88DRAFT_268877 [Tribonema minus]|uniref:Uncharacterized protein n=1 Tax=Tribonema minus TaxID=303371 RepID=A0A835YQ43_9STRA|nr:hypothetical protein JKP88DRAFT_268877 [Tribonema minus]
MAGAARVISLKGPRRIDPAAPVIQFAEDLELIQSFPVHLSFVPLRQPFKSTQWEISQALKKLCPRDSPPLSLEVTLASRGPVTVTARFSDEQSLKVMARAVRHKVLNVSGALLMGDVIEKDVGKSSAAHEVAKQHLTVVLDGVPAKWVECGENGSMEPSRKLLQAMRGFGPVHAVELARSDGDGGGGADGSGAGDNVDAVISTLSPLNVTIWTKFAMTEGFDRALAGLAGRVLRRKGVAMLAPINVSADADGYMADEQREARRLQRLAAAKEAQQAVARLEQHQRTLAKAPAVDFKFNFSDSPCCCAQMSETLDRAASESQRGDFNVSTTDSVVTAAARAQDKLDAARAAVERGRGASKQAQAVDRALAEARAAAAAALQAVRDAQDAAAAAAEAARAEAARRRDALARAEAEPVVQQALAALPEPRRAEAAGGAQAAAAAEAVQRRLAYLLELCGEEGGSAGLGEETLTAVQQGADALQALIAAAELRAAAAAALSTVLLAALEDDWVAALDGVVDSIVPPMSWQWGGGVDALSEDVWEVMADERRALEAEAAAFGAAEALLRGLLRASEQLQEATDTLRVLESSIATDPDNRGLEQSETVVPLLQRARDTLAAARAGAPIDDGAEPVLARLAAARDAAAALRKGLAAERARRAADRAALASEVEARRRREEDAAAARAAAEATLRTISLHRARHDVAAPLDAPRRRSEVATRLTGLKRAQALLREAVRLEDARRRLAALQRQRTHAAAAAAPEASTRGRKRRRAEAGPDPSERWMPGDDEVEVVEVVEGEAKQRPPPLSPPRGPDPASRWPLISKVVIPVREPEGEAALLNGGGGGDGDGGDGGGNSDGEGGGASSNGDAAPAGDTKGGEGGAAGAVEEDAQALEQELRDAVLRALQKR